MNIEDEHATEQMYKIGAVSRLTGVAQDTLRVWERRYDVVVPTRTETGRRVYTQRDISRLALIKRLVDQGDAISSVANLTLEQLQARISQATAPAEMDRRDEPCRLALLGDVQANKLANELQSDEGLILSGLYRDRERFLEAVSSNEVDLIILEYSTLMPEQVKDIGLLLQRSGAARALIIYSFSSSPTLERLESERIIPLRMPVDISEIRRLCRTLHGRPAPSSMRVAENIALSGEIPPRRFSDETLARVATASVSVRCECPHHLVDIITSLSAFEEYSQQCEILNVDDAALHAMLHAATAQARSMIEASLERVIEIDAIDIS
jgi:DNA-binding transcriptional MerR regulator